MKKAGFVHAFSTRAAGNLSDKHGEPGEVAQNKARFLEVVGKSWDIAMLAQTHSDTIVLTDAPADGETGDALISAEPNLFLGIKTADCVPVLIADTKTKAIAAVHAGWRGTLQRIVEKTVEEMAVRFNSKAEDLIAAIGPAACGRCYEVGGDVAENFRTEFSDVRAFMVPSSSPEKFLLNVPAANATQLIRSKVRAENVHVLPYCTMHQHELFFSHRKDDAAGPINRQLSIIGRPS